MQTIGKFVFFRKKYSSSLCCDAGKYTYSLHFSNRLPQSGAGANSLSEGEAVLSPGDARWYSTYATKMGPLQNQTNNKRKSATD